MITLFLTIALQTDASWTARRVHESMVDARLDEWAGHPSLWIVPSAAGHGFDAVGVRDRADARLSVRIGYDDHNVLLAIRWWDDVLDAPRVHRADATRTGPDGRRFDAMYLTDNVKIQFWAGDRNYVAWFSPHDSTDVPYQWHTVRGDAVPTPVPGAPVAALETIEGTQVLELSIPFRDLGVDGRVPGEVRLLVVVTDGDGQHDLDDPTRAIKYLSWLGTLGFGADHHGSEPTGVDSGREGNDR